MVQSQHLRSDYSNSTWINVDPDHPHSDSITTSVTIRVTPQHYSLISWGILWTGFVCAICFATFQVVREYRWIRERKQEETSNSTSNQNHFGGSSGASTTTPGDAETVSSADVTRTIFRRLLLLAMISRTIMIPVQISADSLWLQFLADTLPHMTFASAWTLLVSFFVQLVGVATGSGTNTMPGIVIQLTSYAVYTLLVVLSFYNLLASVLMYALLCCIYAALFGTSLYFCPRLLVLLRPSLSAHSGLAYRLALCCVVCIFVFGARTYGFARKVVLPPQHVLWWWQYGGLELVPSTIFLIMMHPAANRQSHSSTNTPPTTKTLSSGGGGAHRRTNSYGSNGNSSQGRGTRDHHRETAPLIGGNNSNNFRPPMSSYGSASSAEQSHA